MITLDNIGNGSSGDVFPRNVVFNRKYGLNKQLVGDLNTYKFAGGNDYKFLAFGQRDLGVSDLWFTNINSTDSATVFFRKKVDLTNVDTISITCSSVAIATVFNFSVGTTSSLGDRTLSESAVINKTYTMDVSDLVGKYYLGFIIDQTMWVGFSEIVFDVAPPKPSEGNDIILFDSKAGQLNMELTGGFAITKVDVNSGFAFVNASNFTYIYNSVTSNYFAKQIDLTYVNKIKFRGSNTRQNTSSMYLLGAIGTTTNLADRTVTLPFVSTNPAYDDCEDFEIDVSDLNGLYYIGIQSPDYGTLHSIRLAY